MNAADEKEGLIVAHYGVAVEVRFADDERRMVKVKRNSGHVVGDSVKVKGEVLSRLPRRTELRRRDARGGIHLVAANLDVLGIVIAPLSTSAFIDRAIVAARVAGLKPFIVVNKFDLPEAEPLLNTLNNIYKSSVTLFPVSAVYHKGLDQIENYFREGHRGAFVGTAGVGKSSLLNALCPDIDLKVGAVSDYKGLGRHTTTVSTLHVLSKGGELVDTPGFRDFGLVDISVEELAAHYPGFEEHDDLNCRFHNCRHRSEPGCAVLERRKEGRISAERYDTYLSLLDEVEAAEIALKTRLYR